MRTTQISWVTSATDTQTRETTAEAALQAIRTGDKELKTKVESIRASLRSNGDKKAVADLKKQLRGVLWSGTFSQRANDKQVQHSGLLCADLDSLNGDLREVNQKLRQSPHTYAVFISPSGEGLKAVFRVPADATKHAGSYRAVEQHVRELTGRQIDQACKDPARLCFLSYDPDAYHNGDAQEITPLPEPERPKFEASAAMVNISERQRIAVELLGAIEWNSETSGYCACPGKHLHTNTNGERDCEVHLNNAPTVHCFHNSCTGILAGVNHELRSRIGKAEKSDDSQNSSTPPHTAARSDAARLVELARSFSYFHDPLDRAFVQLDVNGHTETWPVESAKFRNLLGKIFYQSDGRIINRNSLGDAIGTLIGIASHDGPEQSVYLRVAPDGENILIDLCDEQWRAVEVTSQGGGA